MQHQTRSDKLKAYGRERRHFEFATGQWEDLDAICAELGLESPTRNKGEPSIGALLRAIADKRLLLVPNPNPPEAIDLYNERQERQRRRRSISERIREG
jgi:hypothetical protein